MYDPVHAWVRLGLAFILTVAIAVTLKKVCKSSQGNFAYILLAFTALLALVDLGFFFLFAFNFFFRYNEEVPNFRVFYALLYVYNLQSIQIWLFAIKYYQSYTKSSFDGVLLSPRQVKLLQSSGIVIYIVALTICYAYILITFPGYNVPGLLLSKWIFDTYKPIVRWIEAIWTTLYAVSFFLTTYSIIKLISMLNAVVKTNRQLQINKF
jgi:hypothetical protein